MSERAAGGQLRQQVGRRLGLSPYYRVVERSEERLVLQSRLEANRSGGYQILAGGVGIVLVALLILASGVYSSLQGGGFGVAAITAAIAGLLANFGLRRLVGGYAVLTTQNQIIADVAEGKLTFNQACRVGKPHSQSLDFTQVRTIRLRRRPLLVGSVLRRMRQIVALELLVGENLWVVDSAEHDSDLQEVAVALHTMIKG
jgi:hypothetical protein